MENHVEPEKADNGSIRVTPEVLEGIAAVRDSGKTNMLDWRTVCDLCYLMGYSEAERWIYANQDKYVRGIFFGFTDRAEGEGGG